MKINYIRNNDHRFRITRLAPKIYCLCKIKMKPIILYWITLLKKLLTFEGLLQANS